MRHRRILTTVRLPILMTKSSCRVPTRPVDCDNICRRGHADDVTKVNENGLVSASPWEGVEGLMQWWGALLSKHRPFGVTRAGGLLVTLGAMNTLQVFFFLMTCLRPCPSATSIGVLP